jgi:hypothetical protein
MDSMRHRWRDSWQRSGLPSLTHRIKQAIREQAATYATHFDSSSSSGGDGGGEWEGEGQRPLSMASLLSLASGSAASDRGRHSAVFELLEVEDARPEPLGGQAQQGMLQALSQQGVLRMLRGSARSRLAASRPAALDLGTELSMGTAGTAGSAADASSLQLRVMISAAAAYSAERMQRMRQLMGDAASAPSPA